MRIPHSLLAIVVLTTCALAEDGRALIPAKVLDERTSNRRSGGTAIGNVIVNLPMPSAPSPTSRNPTQTPPASPVPAQRLVLFEIGDFIYEMEQIGGQRFPVIPDEMVQWYQEKGKYVVIRNSRKYDFAAVEFHRK